MALETLKDINQIGGFKVIRVKPESMSWDDFDKLRNEYPINITERMNCISFKIQNGPIKEVGVNGCQIDAIIETVILILSGLNDKFPCGENSNAIACLEKALFFLEERRIQRELREVEGRNLP